MYKVLKTASSSPILKKLSKAVEQTTQLLNQTLLDDPNISDEALIHILQKKYPKSSIFYDDILEILI